MNVPLKLVKGGRGGREEEEEGGVVVEGKKSTRKIIFSILDFILTNDRISVQEAGRERKRKRV